MLFSYIKSDEKRLSSVHFYFLKLVTETNYVIQNIDAVEVFHEIFKGNGEVPVIFANSRPHQFLHLGIYPIPKLVVVLTSKSCSLSISPRVPHSDDSICLTVTDHIC